MEVVLRDYYPTSLNWTRSKFFVIACIISFVFSLLFLNLLIWNTPTYHVMQTLNSALETLPKDRNGKMSKEYLRVALDTVAPSAGLPPLGAIEEVWCQQDTTKLSSVSFLFRTYFKIYVRAVLTCSCRSFFKCHI